MVTPTKMTTNHCTKRGRKNSFRSVTAFGLVLIDRAINYLFINGATCKPHHHDGSGLLGPQRVHDLHLWLLTERAAYFSPAKYTLSAGESLDAGRSHEML